MERLSSKLKGYSGVNPFRESQAKNYGDDKIVNEFFPTSFYWSLFNEQHEILLGTRGSGKTVLLKMLSYSLLKRLRKIPEALKHIEEKRFIGFYVPLHLEFMEEVQNKGTTTEEKIQYFRFAFNCASAKALLDQLPELLTDCYPKVRERNIKESIITDHITSIWFPDSKIKINSISDLQWNLNIVYNNFSFQVCSNPKNNQAFSRPILAPLLGILPKLTEDLGLDNKNTNWIICIDEAEFLEEPYIKCINTFMRSEKRPLVIKMATLPYKHSTRETTLEGIYIEPNGNDFNYRRIDLDWDSDDFKRLTDHLCKVRLKKCDIEDENLNLDKFLGIEGNDDAIDYYKLEMGTDQASKEEILNGILNALSEKRKQYYNRVQDDPSKIKRPIEHRFAPVYYVRRMKIEEAVGNRTVGWFAGAQMVRRISDGNPRRFIQIMNDIFEKARDSDLNPKNQHRVLMEFSQRSFIASEGLPKYGLIVRNVLGKIGVLLSERVHGTPMMDGGCNFILDPDLIDNNLIMSSVQLAIAYSYIISDDETLYTTITTNSKLRLSYLCAVHFWLPMRKGDSPVIRFSDNLLIKDFLNLNSAPNTRKEVDSIFSQIKFEIKEND